MTPTTKHGKHQRQSHMLTIEDFTKRFHRATPEVIKENLKAGVPVYYEDESGQWVKERPDGTIEVIEEAE